MVKAVIVYISFFFILPCLFTINLNLYLIFPFRSYISKDFEHPAIPAIRVIEGWSLGLLYCKALYSLVLVNGNIAMARNIRDLVQDGWLRPNLRLALRYFILPLGMFMTTTIIAPLAFAYALVYLSEREELSAILKLLFSVIGRSNISADEFADKVLSYIKDKSFFLNIYPICGCGYMMSFVFMLAIYVFRKWGERARDELYLVGERLNNLPQVSQHITEH